MVCAVVGPGQAEVHQEERWTLGQKAGALPLLLILSCVKDLTNGKNDVLEPVSVQNPNTELPILIPMPKGIRWLVSDAILG